MWVSANTRYAMPKDFKIGMLVGLIMVVGIIAWLSTRDSISLETRRAQKHRVQLQKQTKNKTDHAALAQRTSADSSGAVGPFHNMSPAQLSSARSDPSADPAIPATAGQSGAQTLSQDSSRPEVERQRIKTTNFHIVRSGETLQGISQQHYDTTQNWKNILDANPDVVKNPNKIRPGMKLTIPD